MTRRLLSSLAVLVVPAVVISCSGDENSDRDLDPTTSTTDPTPDTSVEFDTSTDSVPMTTQSPGGTEGGCYVMLFDGDDFDESDSRYLINEPGRYASLAGLPGTARDWTGQADGLKVGDTATVTIWPEVNFGGTPETLARGTEIPDMEMSEEPASLELTC